MSRHSPFGQPFLLGFEGIEQALDRLAKSSADGYPPYNVERVPPGEGEPERLRIRLAVAGFTAEQLDVHLEEGQLIVRGRQAEEAGKVYLHRGIAARQFQRTFLLAEGMEVLGADLAHGMLSIELIRPEPPRLSRRIGIVKGD